MKHQEKVTLFTCMLVLRDEGEKVGFLFEGNSFEGALNKAINYAETSKLEFMYTTTVSNDCIAIIEHKGIPATYV